MLILMVGELSLTDSYKTGDLEPGVILTLFLIFRRFQACDSYKINSYKKNTVYVRCWLNLTPSTFISAIRSMGSPLLSISTTVFSRLCLFDICGVEKRIAFVFFELRHWYFSSDQVFTLFISCCISLIVYERLITLELRSMVVSSAYRR